jgi:hypothetical protein
MIAVGDTVALCRRGWLPALALGLLAHVAFALPAAPSQPARPHLVVILADDFGYECVGANGSAAYRTPRLDRPPPKASVSNTPTPSRCARPAASSS